MATYNELKKIIPQDQAIANKALSRSLQQIKQIFNADLPSLALVTGNLESNKNLPLINALTTPIPSSVSSFYSDTFATGTGPGNLLTINDVIGTPTGNTFNTALPVTISTMTELQNVGAFAPLISNGGVPSSINNGIYTIMSYCIDNFYVGEDGNIYLPTTSYFTPSNPYADNDEAFSNALIPAASSILSNIASTYSNVVTISNQASANMAWQLSINLVNSQKAGLNISNIVNSIGNANLEPNQTSATMSLITSLHSIGQDITEGGPAQFFELTANTSLLSGQAVIGSMREGRNIALLNAAGILLDTQLIDSNPNPVFSNSITNGQYTTAEAQSSIRF